MFDGDMDLIEGNLEFLVTSHGHLERGSVGKEKQMGGWDHIKGLISDRYHYDQGEKRIIMG